MLDAPGALECWHVLLWLQGLTSGTCTSSPFGGITPFCLTLKVTGPELGLEQMRGLWLSCAFLRLQSLTQRPLQWRLVRGVRPMCASTQLEGLALSITMAVGVSLGAPG